MIENISPKRMVKSNYICILAASDEDLFNFYCNTKLSESSDMTKTSSNMLLLNVFKLIL